MPGGRPTKLDQLVPDTNLTTGDFIVERTRTLWLPWEDIAAMAGVNRATVRDWRRAGVRARAKAALGHELEPKEEALAEFSASLERAEVEGMALRLGIIQREAQGGYEMRKTVTKSYVTKAGEEVTEVVTTVETARPQWTAAAWQLERKMPDRFALGPTRVEISGRGGGPVRVESSEEGRAGELADSLRAYQAGIEAAQALEAERAQANGVEHPE